MGEWEGLQEESEDACAGGTKARLEFEGPQFSSQVGKFIEEKEEG